MRTKPILELRALLARYVHITYYHRESPVIKSVTLLPSFWDTYLDSPLRTRVEAILTSHKYISSISSFYYSSHYPYSTQSIILDALLLTVLETTYELI